MTTSLAIAAVTARLQGILDTALSADVPFAEVTTRPPDRAREESTGNQVNLFLYNMTINPAWRNGDLPWRVNPGETGHAPLPLNLYYVVTAYAGESENGIARGPTDDFTGSYRLLGAAMLALHDYPVLTAEEINSLLGAGDLDNHVFDQVERVRITPHSLSPDETGKLWAGFQTPYRPSMTYEVSVVLIESRRQRVSPLPVLRRGSEDRGVDAVIGPFPVLDEIRRPPRTRPGFQYGDRAILNGRNLGGEPVLVRLFHPLRPERALLLTPGPESTESRLEVDLRGGREVRLEDGVETDLSADADALLVWTAGFYEVTVEGHIVGAPPRLSNTLPLALSPHVTSITPNPALRDANGDVSLTLTCRPEVTRQQHARLILGDREIPADEHLALTDTLSFRIVDAPAGVFVTRLRIDGVDSLPAVIPPPDAQGRPQPPIFDPAQTVTING